MTAIFPSVEIEMPVTRVELDDFRAFALQLIENQEVESLEECLNRWGHEASLAGIREALEDSTAGRSQQVDEAFAQIRCELGLPQRRPVS